MSQLLHHKGYFGSVDLSADDEVLHGRLEFIRDLVTYEAVDARGLKVAFEAAVDDYLETCAQEGREPDTPLGGRLDVEAGRDLHRRAMLYARRHGATLDTVVADALRRFLDSAERAS